MKDGESLANPPTIVVRGRYGHRRRRRDPFRGAYDAALDALGLRRVIQLPENSGTDGSFRRQRAQRVIRLGPADIDGSDHRETMRRLHRDRHKVQSRSLPRGSRTARSNTAPRAAEALGARGIRVEQPGGLAGALDAGLRGEGVTVIDLVVACDPAKMLPAADNRAVRLQAGDRVA